VALLFTLKKYLKAKEELFGNSNIFTMQKYKSSQKKSSKRNQNPSRYIRTLITHLKVQHKPKLIVQDFII
jgi:hypothetical protein